MQAPESPRSRQPSPEMIETSSGRWHMPIIHKPTRRYICAVVGDLYARLSPHLTDRARARAFARVHARLIRLSNGRIRRFMGAEILLLGNVGRRSGQSRVTPVLFIRDGEALAVVASNAASRNLPAWWLNLQARPEDEVLLHGTWRRAQAPHGDVLRL